VSIREGERFPIDRGASGKILIAFSKPSRASHDAVRERLWALSYGERDPDTAAVSAPVLGPNNELAGALTLSGPKDRLGATETMRAACNLLLTAAARATAALGGDHRIFAYGMALAAQFDFPPPTEVQKA
jgi:DNA-binding IclR family transcriptional regulator